MPVGGCGGATFPMWTVQIYADNVACTPFRVDLLPNAPRRAASRLLVAVLAPVIVDDVPEAVGVATAIASEEHRVTGSGG